jgi:integrase
MASLQARHVGGCAIGKPWTPLERRDHTGNIVWKLDDECTCPRGPLYHVVVRDGAAAHKTAVGRNRREAERSLTRLQAQSDAGTYQHEKRIRFDEWGDRWLDSLERKQNTVRSYRSTITAAKTAFGSKVVRQISSDDVKRLLVSLRDDGRSSSTRAKHLRVLGACFESAIAAGYAARNPVRVIPRSEKPRAVKKESAYFENDELPLVFAGLHGSPYRTLALVALKTGMRQGELLALTWGDVSLVDGVLRVRRTYTDGHLDEPKTHERRDVDLSPEVVDLLGEWWDELGKPADNTLVFPGATVSGYLNTKQLLAAFYAALESGGREPADKDEERPPAVRRVGPTGELRTWHSLRHTFAKVALENGRSITWLQRQLGHKSITITIDRYGHWERAARRLEVEQLVGAFNV